jgi:hypothetical protein
MYGGEWSASCTSLYTTQRKGRNYALNLRLDGSQKQSERLKKRKRLVLPRIEVWSCGAQTVSCNFPFQLPVIPLQVRTSPGGSRRLRLPEFLDNWQMKMATFSALGTGRLYPPGKIPGTLLEAESTPGPYYDQKIWVYEKLQWSHRQSKPPPSGW